MSQGKALSPGEQSVQCNIRWSPELYVRLKAAADLHGLPVSEAVRLLVAWGLQRIDNVEVLGQD